MSINRVETVHTGLPGAPYLSVHHFIQAGDPDATQAQAMVDAIRDFWTALAPKMSISNTAQVSGQVKQLNPDGSLAGITPVTTRTVPGTAPAGDPLPSQTVGLISWKTPIVAGGRQIKGHTFVPAPSEADNAFAVPLSTYVTALQTAANALIANASTDLAVFSRTHLQAGGVTAAVVSGVWHSLASHRQ